MIPCPGNNVDVSFQYQLKRPSSSSQVKPERLPFVSRFESVWNEAAQTAGAASIRITNSIDDEEPVDDDFVYLESSRLQ